MATVKEGDKVRVVTRPITEQDRSVYKFFDHMHGLEGVVAAVYNKEEVAVNVDLDQLQGVPKEIHGVATKRMQESFKEASTENQRKLLDKDEMKFTPNYVLLVREADLEKI